MAKHKTARPPDLETRIACVRLVLDAAVKYGVPAALIVSHSNHGLASKARKEVQAAMFDQLGVKRRWIAWLFDRDLRRVRASELGQKVERKYCRRTGVRPRYREILVSVGHQLVWIECAPMVVPVTFKLPMRPISARAINSLDDAGRAELVRFLEAQKARVMAGV